MHLKRILLSLLLVLALTGCKGDGSDYPDVESLMGTWQCEATYPEDGHDLTAWNFEDTYFTFNYGGTMRTEGFYGFADGRWSADKSILNCTLSDGTALRIRLISVSKTSADVKVTTIFGSKCIILKRINK